MVVNVDEKILDRFLPLIPAECQDEVQSGEWFCLGALSGEGEEKLPVGVLLFSAEDGMMNETEPATMLLLKWLYIAEEHRQKGFANELMDALSDILEDNPAEGILCDVPFDSEYDLLEAFLTSWGFQFEVTDTHEMIISKEDCRKQISSINKEEALSLATASEKPKGMLSLPEIPEKTFRKALRAAKEMEKSGYYDLLSENSEDYAGDMSYVFLHDDEISSMALFERLPDDNLHMVMLSASNPDGAKELLTLLHYAAGYYYLNYPEETKIRLTLGTQKSRNLATHLFPDKDPVMVRRGYFY